jgi:4-carboxymuconolactone decarboxylase
MPEKPNSRGRLEDALSAGLEPWSIALARAAAAVAKGGDALLRIRFTEAIGAGVPSLWIEELLLQSFLNVGYPLSLAAFGVWREIAGPVTQVGEPLEHRNHEAWATRGAETCGVVYGRTYQKLLTNIRALHPAVERLVVIDAYGKILGRPAEGFDAKQRELGTLSAIAMLDAPRQLHAHLRGALNQGWTREEIDAVLLLLEDDMGPEKAEAARQLWSAVKERGL